MERNGKRSGLNGAQLKGIAFGTMVVDHAAVMLLQETGTLYWSMRLIGRLAFPLYCFLLAEGFCHTRSAGRYLGRLAALAVVSEIPFNLLNRGAAADPMHQNVMFTLFLGLLALWGNMTLQNRGKAFAGLLWCACMAALAEVFIRGNDEVAGVAGTFPQSVVTSGGENKAAFHQRRPSFPLDYTIKFPKKPALFHWETI